MAVANVAQQNNRHISIFCLSSNGNNKKLEFVKRRYFKMKLYVGNLGDGGTITSDDLRPLFEAYGTVTECECIKNYA